MEQLLKSLGHPTVKLIIYRHRFFDGFSFDLDLDLVYFIGLVSFSLTQELDKDNGPAILNKIVGFG